MIARDCGSQPIHLALSAAGSSAGRDTLVVDTGEHRVIAIDLATGDTSPVITGLDISATVVEVLLPTGMLSDITIGPDGAIYVSDDGVNSVYRFER